MYENAASNASSYSSAAEPDPQQAAAMLEAAAGRDDPEALRTLGHMKQQGIGLPRHLPLQRPAPRCAR